MDAWYALGLLNSSTIDCEGFLPALSNSMMNDLDQAGGIEMLSKELGD